MIHRYPDLLRPAMVCALALLVDVFISSLRLPIPQLLPLLVLYQVLHRQRHLSLAAICAIGLLQDALWLTVLGKHALALAVLLCTVLRLHRYVYLLDSWRLAPLVMALYLLWGLVHGWIDYLGGYAPDLGRLLLESLFAAVLWPLLLIAANLLQPMKR